MEQKVFKVLITGAAGQIVYSLLEMIASGRMFGTTPVILHLLDIPGMEDKLQGMAMELEDLASPLLKDVKTFTGDAEEAFRGIDAALLIGAMPRKEGMERKDLLKINAKIFKTQGEALNRHAPAHVKVLVVGNPANTNALIASHYATKIPKENFTALTMLDHNRARAMIAKKLHVSVEQVKNVTIWGNHSSTQYPDLFNALVIDFPQKGRITRVMDALKGEEAWIKNEFITGVQQRGAAIIKLRKVSSAMSAAKAICDHMRFWVLGTGTTGASDKDEWISMGVVSDGKTYKDIPEGIVFSMPVTCHNGKISVVKDLICTESPSSMAPYIEKTLSELLEEKQAVFE